MGRGRGWNSRLRKSFQHTEGLQGADSCVVREGLLEKPLGLNLEDQKGKACSWKGQIRSHNGLVIAVVILPVP